MRIPVDLLLTLGANLAAPVLLIAWTALVRPNSRIEGVLVALSAGAYLLFVWRASPVWFWVGGYWLAMLAVLYSIAVAVLVLHMRHLPWLPPSRASYAGIVVLALVVSIFVFRSATLMGARSFSSPALDLAFPLRGGTFAVVNGGSTTLLNHHYADPAQRYALDIIAIDDRGRRASRLRPARLDAYRIYDDPVFAPCEGVVVDTRDGLAEDLEMEEDLALAAGNYVTLVCGGYTVLLAHLKPGTVGVSPGDHVGPSMVVGRVGSSGSSTEPHLHIHAAQGRISDHQALLRGATSVPLRFAGRFLIRNDTVES